MKFLIIMLLALCCIERATASIIYESATLGPTGQQGGYVIYHPHFLGARFSIERATEITSIGGHIDGKDGTRLEPIIGNGLLFGAIVSLDDFSDFPDSDDLSSSDVLGHVLFEPPRTSMDVDVGMSLVINPGTYGVIFGTGLFGATGRGYMTRGNTDIDSPSYFFWNSTWRKHLATETRFTVNGHAVPEPSTVSLMGIGALATVFARRQRTKRNAVIYPTAKQKVIPDRSVEKW